MSSNQNPGYLIYIGKKKLPSYMGTIIGHYKDPWLEGFGNRVAQMAWVEAGLPPAGLPLEFNYAE